MDRMVNPNLIPKHLDPFGGKPPRELLTYTISGRTTRWDGYVVEGVRIAFVDKASNTEAAYTWSDANGMFQAVVQTNPNGYRVTARKTDWGFSPAYYDAADKTDAIWFRGNYYGKGDSKDPDPK